MYFDQPSMVKIRDESECECEDLKKLKKSERM